jgi:quercetin dioxygenase-like cupin family protein
MSELFSESSDEPPAAITARRSLCDIDHAVRVETQKLRLLLSLHRPQAETDDSGLSKIRAKTSEEFGELVHHAGEEFVYVLSGKVTVNTEYYDAVTLDVGQSIYIDSSMGHAYLAAEGCDEAVVLAVMSSGDEELLQSLMSIHEGQQGTSSQGI